MRPCSMAEVQDLCQRFHGYGGAGNTAVYSWAVYEGRRAVAAFAWQPPPPGAARSVCPECPGAVLTLSRMVACPKAERALKHISKPLKTQMRHLIDRGRWPVLVTYSDRGQGHTGYVYQCSGWSRAGESRRPTLTDAEGRRVSTYSAGRHVERKDCVRGITILDRWEHWVCDRGGVEEWMRAHGWNKKPVPGKVWRSGSPAYTWEQVP